MDEKDPKAAINLDHFHNPFFREAARCLVAEYYDYYRDRLAAIYVRGSTHRNEAIPGVSDLDDLTFLHDDFTEADRTYWAQQKYKLSEEFPGVELGYARKASSFLENIYVKICLKYDATLVWGNNLITGEDIPLPDGSHFWDAWQITRYAAGLDSENRTDHRLPADPQLRLRKLARNAVLGGAALLIAHGKFRSYRGVDVLPTLIEAYPQWEDFLIETNSLYIQLTEAAEEKLTPYLSRLVAWMDWVGAHVLPSAENHLVRCQNTDHILDIAKTVISNLHCT